MRTFGKEFKWSNWSTKNLAELKIKVTLRFLIFANINSKAWRMQGRQAEIPTLIAVPEAHDNTKGRRKKNDHRSWILYDGLGGGGWLGYRNGQRFSVGVFK
jgi:hypothetical protein